MSVNRYQILISIFNLQWMDKLKNTLRIILLFIVYDMNSIKYQIISRGWTKKSIKNRLENFLVYFIK